MLEQGFFFIFVGNFLPVVGYLIDSNPCRFFFETFGWLKGLASVVLAFFFSQNVLAQQLVLPFSMSQESPMAFAVDSLSLMRHSPGSFSSGSPHASSQALTLQMQFCVVGAELPRDRILILTPRISDNTHSVAFPGIEIYGSWAYYAFLRGRTQYNNVRNTAQQPIGLRSGEVHNFLPYEQSVGWESWMSDATVTFDLCYKDGCGVLREDSRAAFPSTVGSQLKGKPDLSTPPLFVDRSEYQFQTFRPILALKTNLLYDLILAPNIEVELPLDQRCRWSLMGEYWNPWYRWKRLDYAYQIQGGGLELRRWFSPRCDGSRPFLSGQFWGVYAAAARYDLEYDQTGDQGDVFSGGLTYGYSLPIGRCWNLEMSISGGVVAGQRRHYNAEFESTHLIYKYTKNLFYAGPTKLKLSLVWIIGKKKD